MSDQIATSLVDQFHANIDLLLQQKGSKLEMCVRNETQNGEFQFFDRIGQRTAKENTTRHGDTEYADTQHDRRGVFLRNFDDADLIDRKDKLEMLADPTSSYSVNLASALNRVKDDVLIESFFGNALSGRRGETQVPFSASHVIAKDYVEVGAPADSGLTIAKLRRARTILANAENEWGDEEAYIAVTPDALQDLLRTTEVTSQDFNTVRALVNGNIDSFMGFKFIEITRLNKTKVVAGGTATRIPVWVKSGMLLTKAQDTTIMVDRLPTKRYSVQVYGSIDIGSSRMEEGKVVEIERFNS